MILETISANGKVVSEIQDAPTIKIDLDVVRQRTVTSILKLEVENSEGVHATFWVSVAIKNGRPVAEIATEPSEGKFVRKSVTGTCNRV